MLLHMRAGTPHRYVETELWVEQEPEIVVTGMQLYNRSVDVGFNMGCAHFLFPQLASLASNCHKKFSRRGMVVQGWRGPSH